MVTERDKRGCAERRKKPLSWGSLLLSAPRHWVGAGKISAGQQGWGDTYITLRASPAVPPPPAMYKFQDSLIWP